MEEEYVKNFDKIFNTELSKNMRTNMPLLNKIFYYFEYDIYVLDSRQKELGKEKLLVYDELSRSMSEKQVDLLNKYCELQNEVTIDLEKQLFIFGYLVAMELNREISY